MLGGPSIDQDSDEVRSGQSKLVQSVERALSMLEEVAASVAPLTTSEVARRAGVNRGTAWRLLSTLEHFHLVERDPLNGRYSVGSSPARLAAASDAGPLVRRARPVLEEICAELDECVYLMVSTGYTMTVLDEVRASRPVQVNLAGLDVPLHAGSAGKLFLAFLPQNELDELLSKPLESFTSRTVSDPAQLRAELDRARADRFAVAYQEHLPDWGGASAAVCDRRGIPVAYLNVTVPAYRYSADELQVLSEPLLRGAAQLEKRLLPTRSDTNRLPVP